MLKLTMITEAVTTNPCFSIKCPECDYITQFRIMGPMACSNCLALLPEGVNVILMSEDRYDYFISCKGLELY